MMLKGVLLISGILVGSVVVDGMIAAISYKLEEQAIKRIKLIKKVGLFGAGIVVGML